MPQTDQGLKSPRCSALPRLELRAQGPLNRQLSRKIRAIELPELTGGSIHVSTGRSLMAHRGHLVRDSSRGSAVYAAAFLRDRKIILEAGLLSNSQTFRLILVHELFHFVWLRLGNRARGEFDRVLRREWKSGARGELGESAGVQKAKLRQTSAGVSSRHWRDYVCESFCDTAAWLYAEVEDGSSFTLAKGWRERRNSWFQSVANNGPWRC